MGVLVGVLLLYGIQTYNKLLESRIESEEVEETIYNDSAWIEGGWKRL